MFKAIKDHLGKRIQFKEVSVTSGCGNWQTEIKEENFYFQLQHIEDKNE